MKMVLQWEDVQNYTLTKYQRQNVHVIMFRVKVQRR